MTISICVREFCEHNINEVCDNECLNTEDTVKSNFGDVGIKLACMANNKENFFQFIRCSEKEFGIEEADVFSMKLNELESYIEFLDYLWDK